MPLGRDRKSVPKYVHKIFVPWRDGFGAGQIGHDATTAPLTPSPRPALFDPPTEVRAIVRHYTFSIEDLALNPATAPQCEPLRVCGAVRRKVICESVSAICE